MRVSASMFCAVFIAAGLSGCAQAPPPTPAAPAPAAPSGPHSEGGHEGHHGGHHGHHDGPLVHRFEKAEDWAKRFDDPARDAWQMPAEVIAKLGLAEGMHVADIGAGTGYFLPYLSRAVGQSGRVFGLDIEPDMVRYMIERAAREGLANVEARVVEGGDPGLSAAPFDRILIVDTWHHIPDRGAYSVRLREALKPGGSVFIVDFTQASSHGPPVQHRIRAEQVVSELASGGLDASIVESSLPDQYIVMGRRSP